MDTSTQTVVVLNRLGLHMRPADLLVRTASRYQSQIEIAKDGQVVDCKSILGLLTLAAAQGTQLELRATGGDAAQAVQAISELFTQSFNETDSDGASPPTTN